MDAATIIESESGVVATFLDFLDANEKAAAMAKNNSVAQFKAPDGFCTVAGLANLKTVNESKEIQTYKTDPAFFGQLSDYAEGARYAQLRAEQGRGVRAVQSEPWSGDGICEARKKASWSQGELGERPGVSGPTIGRVETNNDVPTATNAKIGQAIGPNLELN